MSNEEERVLGQHLTKEQTNELKKLLKDLNSLAKEVFDDYNENPSEISGSVVQIHENSPLLNEKSNDSK